MENTEKAIERWMVRNVQDYVDECGEVDCTGIVEAWDRACADGGETLDPNHVAWTVAIYVAQRYEAQQAARASYSRRDRDRLAFG